MILLTGDMHGQLDIGKLTTKQFPSINMTKNDYVIILGDFGVLWQQVPNRTEQYLKDFFRAKPYTTLFIDGNHENHARINALPVEQWNGGNVHCVTDDIIHLMRGQHYVIDGISFFTMGGAESYDKAYRTENISWWKEEIPDYAESNEGFDTLQRINHKTDYMLTHTCPRHIMPNFVYSKVISHIGDDPTTKLLNEYDALTDYKHWFFGHFHVDMRLTEKHTCLYNSIVEVRKDGFEWVAGIQLVR